MAKSSAPVTVKVIEAAPMLELIDPARITVKNVRKAKPDPEFIESIRDLGNVQPIAVLRTADGELVLRFGLQRLQACIETGRKVLAMVIDGAAGTDEAEVERIFLQLAENHQRQDLTAAEDAGAVQELFDLGVDIEVITRRTNLDKWQITAARKVAASETARAVAAQYPLNLEQSAAIAEFEDDTTAVGVLVEAAKEGAVRFAHRLQEARDAREDREAIDSHIARLEKGGLIATRDKPHWEYQIERWTDGDGRQLTPEAHKDCPGNVVHVAVYRSDHKTFETWYCAEPRDHGHKLYRAPASGSGTAKSKDEAAADRAGVIAGNNAWRTAESVRRDWLRELLARPKAPDGAVPYVLEAFTLSDARLRYAMDHRDSGQHAMARDLLGLARSKGPGWSAPPEVHTAMTTASPARRPVIALAIILGAYEGSTGVHTWRSPTPETAEYLHALEGWGYQLSDCEQELVTTVRKREADHAAKVQQDEAAVAEHDDNADEAATAAGTEGVR